MTPAPLSSARPLSWFGRAEAWLDDRGKGAWIAAMVLGFILFWPIGLALLAYMIWSKQMFSGNCRSVAKRHSYSPSTRSSGNAAFDAYREETLRRLQEEQDAFQSFLDRLRAAKDQAEFDAFMEDRARNRGSASASDTDTDRDDTGDTPEDGAPRPA